MTSSTGTQSNILYNISATGEITSNSTFYRTQFNYMDYCFTLSMPLVVANIAAGMFVTAMNITIILTLLQSRSLRKFVYMVFLVALLVSHCFSGLCCVVIGVVWLAISDIKLECNAMQWFGRIGRTISCCGFLLVMLLTIDRAVSVKLPFRYKNLTHRHAVVLSFVAVVFAAFHFVMTIDHFVEIQNLTSKVFVVVSSVLIVCNGLVYVEVRRHLEKMKLVAVGANEQQRKASVQKLEKQKLKSIIVSLMFVLSFITLWSPLIIVVALEQYTTNFRFTKDLTMSLILVATLNSIVDPVVYILLNKTVRKELRRTLSNTLFGKSSVTTVPVSTTDSKVSH